MKSLLSSRLFWALKEFFSLDGLSSSCKRVNRVAGKPGNEGKRVSEFNESHPRCACEICRVSKYSPSPVLSAEILVRFVLHPMHVNEKTGEIKASLFSHVEGKGCSVQRELWATNTELSLFLKKVCPAEAKTSWFGVVSATAGQIRTLQVAGDSRQTFWVYDTAEKDNPSHAEVGRAMNELKTEDIQELRYELMKLFSPSTQLIKPLHYRDGVLLPNK
jgi:hypothetical protein